jgi:hypothetical protein
MEMIVKKAAAAAISIAVKRAEAGNPLLEKR